MGFCDASQQSYEILVFCFLPFPLKTYPLNARAISKCSSLHFSPKAVNSSLVIGISNLAPSASKVSKIAHSLSWL